MEWQVKKLGDVCRIIGGGTPSKSNESFYEGDIPWATVRDMHDSLLSNTQFKITNEAVEKSSTNIIPSGTIIIATRVGLGKVCILQQDTAINQDLKGVIPKTAGLDNSFLYWWLRSVAHVIVAAGTGATVQGVRMSFVNSLKIPLPPIPEQKRIAAILDEAFADIEQVRAKTEQNLKNAHELFESYLQQVAGEKKPLGEFVSIKTGKLNANAAVEGGQFPFFTCSREVFAIDSFSFDCEAILLAGNNASGDFNVKHYNGKFDAYQRTYVITITDEHKLLYPFLYYQMIKSLKELKEGSVGAGTRFLKIGMIQNLKISIPSLSEQKKILSTLLVLKEELDRLEQIYEEKLEHLDELKQSILQKAFSGELTSS